MFFGFYYLNNANFVDNVKRKSKCCFFFFRRMKGGEKRGMKGNASTMSSGTMRYDGFLYHPTYIHLLVYSVNDTYHSLACRLRLKTWRLTG